MGRYHDTRRLVDAEATVVGGFSDAFFFTAFARSEVGMVRSGALHE